MDPRDRRTRRWRAISTDEPDPEADQDSARWPTDVVLPALDRCSQLADELARLLLSPELFGESGSAGEQPT